MTMQPEQWRKSSRSNENTDCVEVSNRGRIRDSKNPSGPKLLLRVAGLLAAVKAGRLDR